MRAVMLHAATYPDDGVTHWDGWHDLNSAERTMWLERAWADLEAELHSRGSG